MDGFPHDYGQPCCCVDCETVEHRPDLLGERCERCNLAAEPGDPDELAAALTAAYESAVLRALGQTSWLD